MPLQPFLAVPLVRGLWKYGCLFRPNAKGSDLGLCLLCSDRNTRPSFDTREHLCSTGGGVKRAWFHCTPLLDDELGAGVLASIMRTVAEDMPWSEPRHCILTSDYSYVVGHDPASCAIANSKLYSILSRPSPQR